MPAVPHSLNFILQFILVFLTVRNFASADYQLPLSEFLALKEFFYSTNGPTWNWKQQSSKNGYIWNFTASDNQNPCSIDHHWQGLNCTSSCVNEPCHIRSIHLKTYNLTGSLPESIGNLSHLEILNLDRNQICSQIPISLFSLSNLEEINFHDNCFSGTISANISNLRNLSVLNFHVNFLHGSIPASIGWLQRLTILHLAENNLTASIPYSIGNLTFLTDLSLYQNAFTGTLPESIGSLIQLQTLALQRNNFQGSLPSSFSQLTNLTRFLLDTNNITGTLPLCLTNMKKLSFMDFSRNGFYGTIPYQFGAFPDLIDLELNGNSLTGTLPPSLGYMPQLKYLLLQGNKLNGTIPASFENLREAEALKFNKNMFSGTLPAQLGNLSHLQTLYLSDNRFSGTLPVSLTRLGSLKTLFANRNNFRGSLFANWTSLSGLTVVAFDNNAFSGTIDNSFCDLRLKQFTAANNSLSGTIPNCEITTFSQMEILSVQNNSLGGTLPSTLVTNSLQSLDVSVNHFSGSIPEEWFSHAERLVSLVMAINCFSGSLPSSICLAKNLSHLSMDGLHSADYCTMKVIPFYSQSALIMLGEGVRGSIPGCIFSDLPYLRIFHASGNRFIGTLVAELRNSSIESLVLSNNLLEGSIPLSIWGNSLLKHIDLSFNEFRDDLEFLPVLSESATYVHLQDNRLSGNVPQYLLGMISIDLLQGNLFACNTQRSNLPDHDPVHHSYVCGSDSMNDALAVYIFALIALFVVFLSSMIIVSKSYFFTLLLAGNCVIHSQFVNVSRWFSSSDFVNGDFFITWLTNGCGNTQMIQCDQRVYREIGAAFILVTKIKMLLLFFAVCILLPVYVSLGYFPKTYEVGVYEHRYLWNISGLYLQGNWVMFIFLGLFFVLQLSVSSMLTMPSWYQSDSHPVKQFLKSRGSNSSYSEMNDNVETADDENSPNAACRYLSSCCSMLFQKGTWSFALVVVMNVIIVVAINVGFITSISQNQYTPTDITLISAAISIFKTFWNALLWALASSRVLRRDYGLVITVHALLMFSLFNNILVPFLAEAFVSPNCFLYLVSAAPDVTVTTLSLSCKTELTCTNDVCDTFTKCPSPNARLPELEADGATFLTLMYTPPFHYSFQCGSTLISDFLPVFVYRYLFVAIVQPLFVLIALMMRKLSKPSTHHHENLELNKRGNMESDIDFVSFCCSSWKKYTTFSGAILNSLPLMWMVLIAAPSSFITDEFDEIETAFSTSAKTQSAPSSPSSRNVSNPIRASRDVESSGKIRKNIPININREAIYGISQQRLILLVNQIRFRLTVNSATDVAIALSFGVFFPPLVIFIVFNSLKDVFLYRVLLRILFKRDFNLNQHLNGDMARSSSDSTPGGPRGWLRQCIYLFTGVYSVASDGAWMSLMCCTLFWCILLVDMMGNTQNITISIAWLVAVIFVCPWILSGCKYVFLTYIRPSKASSMKTLSKDSVNFEENVAKMDDLFVGYKARSAMEMPELSRASLVDGTVDNPIRYSGNSRSSKLR